MSKRKRKYAYRNPSAASRRAKAKWAAKHGKQYYHAYNLKHRYNMTPTDFDQMVSDQGGLCPLCGERLTVENRRNVHVDHDHETGKVRGILCRRCNRGIGILRDNPQIMCNAVRYLGGKCV